MYLFERMYLNMSTFSMVLWPSLKLRSFPGHNFETIGLMDQMLYNDLQEL